MPRRAGQLMLRQYSLLLPSVCPSGRFRGRLVTNAISPQHALPTVTPGRNSPRIDDLAFHVKSTDEEAVTFVFGVLKNRASVLSHQDGVGWVIVDSELVSDIVLCADSVQLNPWSGGVSQIVVPNVAGRPPGHRALLDAVDQTARLSLP